MAAESHCERRRNVEEGNRRARVFCIAAACSYSARLLKQSRCSFVFMRRAVGRLHISRPAIGAVDRFASLVQFRRVDVATKSIAASDRGESLPTGGGRLCSHQNGYPHRPYANIEAMAITLASNLPKLRSG